jgi:DNA-binding HxlR family transcriptional regulator
VLNSDYAGQNCSIARALEAVGERWTLLIVRELLMGPRRFSQLERRLGVARNVLTQRLDKLVALGIAVRVATDDTPKGQGYELTSKGVDLFPVINALRAWGDAHDAPAGPPAYFEHECGHHDGFALVCRACGDEAHGGNVRAIPGPGLLATR